jgi:hypothetical protein
MMHGRKHKIVAITLCSALAACSGSADSGTQPTANAPQVSTIGVTEGLQSALCGRDYSRAMTALNDGGMGVDESAFWRGYILEMSGQVMHASAIYETLITNGTDTTVSLSCSDRQLVGGLTAEEASKRLALIRSKLLALDANFSAPLTPTHKGLAQSAKPVETSKPVVTAASKPKADPTPVQNQTTAAASGLKIKPLIVEVPPSQSNTGDWFAHFSSYSSSENADSYLAVLEGKYPALIGVIEKWQISSGGGAAWRLGVRAGEWSDVDRLCVVIRSKGDYCRVIDTNQ